jgi:hypothetical protein
MRARTTRMRRTITRTLLIQKAANLPPPASAYRYEDLVEGFGDTCSEINFAYLRNRTELS